MLGSLPSLIAPKLHREYQPNQAQSKGHRIALSLQSRKIPSGVTQNRPMRVTSKPANEKPGTLTPKRALIGSFGMSNVLSEEKEQQVIALGKLGWPLRRIDQATGVRSKPG